MPKRLAEMTPDEARSYCEALERKREWRHAQTLTGCFEASMSSLDALTAHFDDPGKVAVFSDKGAAASRIVACGDESPETVRRRKLDHAAQKLRRAGKGELVRVLLLINKNGSNRKESIWEIARRDASTSHT